MSRAKDRLRAKGIDAAEISASRMIMVPLSSLRIAPKGHKLHDPRSLYPADKDMAADMVARVERGECPNKKALVVWEQPDGMLVCDGHQRHNALHVAAEKLGKSPDDLRVMVEFFTGDEAAFLLRRLAENDHDAFTKKDRASILAFRVRQLTALGVNERDIADAMPKGIGRAEVEALARFDNLTREARALFDDGAFPIGLLAAVLEAPRDEQVQRGHKLVAAGVKSTRGATRRTNAERDKSDPWARRMSPAVMVRAAVALGGPDVEALVQHAASARDSEVLAAIAIGYLLAANHESAKILRALPRGMGRVVREARAVKPRKALPA